MLEDPQSQSGFGETEPEIDWNVITREHLVQWYDSDEKLVRTVGDYLLEALIRSDAGIVIATPTRRLAIERCLSVRGLDTDDLQRAGRYIPLDARDTLDRFMIGGLPDPALFIEFVGPIVSRAAASWGGVRAFGEMVQLLWEEGNRQGAFELERLWNDLGKRYAFALFCAYRKHSLDTDSDQEAFAKVCDAHSVVIL